MPLTTEETRSWIIELIAKAIATGLVVVVGTMPFWREVLDLNKQQIAMLNKSEEGRINRFSSLELANGRLDSEIKMSRADVAQLSAQMILMQATCEKELKK